MPARPSRIPRKRRPRGSLSREHVVRTALELMSGTDAPPITMKRVAEALDTRAMSLYSHVENRDDLLNAAADLALREWTVDLPPRATWEREVRAWCGSLRDCVRRYPALIWEIVRSGKFHPAILEKTAILSRSLRRSGIDDRELSALLRWIPQTVLGAIVLELSRPSDLQSSGDEESAIYASMGALSAEDRSEFLEILPHYGEHNLDDFFNYSVDRLIDGIRTITKENSK